MSLGPLSYCPSLPLSGVCRCTRRSGSRSLPGAGRHFDKSGRCLIPASAFFEFTGKRYPKAKHRFALKGAPITAIGGIWREGHADHPPSFTTLTTAPGPDVAPYHNRQIVVLRPEDWSAWIHLSKTEAELLRPLAHSMLQRYARGVAEFGSIETARHRRPNRRFTQPPQSFCLVWSSSPPPHGGD
jgi:hypothetical protein